MSDTNVEELAASINPYEVLGVHEKATSNEIKSAYKKQALRHHPDKVTQEQRESAHQKFHEISFAYAILSDERRRRRFDTTGNTAESLDIDDDGFDWMDYFRSQYANVVDGSAIDKLKAGYQGGEEERRDILAAYQKFEGDLDKIYETVLLSNPLDDEDRFRKIIQDAIDSREVNDYRKFSREPTSKRKARLRKAEKEAAEADELAGELGLEERLGKPAKGKHDEKTASNTGAAEAASGKSKKNSGDELAAIINQRQKSRASTFLSDLEAKYTTPGNKKKSGNNKRAAGMEEPSEEAFAATAARKQQKNSDKTGGPKKKTRSKKTES